MGFSHILKIEKSKKRGKKLFKKIIFAVLNA